VAIRNPSWQRGAALALGVLALCACGKKAPLRLADAQTPERAPALRAGVRENRVRLDFQVPAHRMFPEREDPWVLARILRQSGPAAQQVEAGTVLKAEGFAFGARLTWSDQPLAPGGYVYRVEFRDAIRRRRAITPPIEVSWDQAPAAPAGLTAVGHLRSVVLSWAAPAGGDAQLAYRVYRRERADASFQLAAPEPATETRFVDPRAEAGLERCYVVRAVRVVGKLEVEGPASLESCARPAPEDLPGDRPPDEQP
jgi:predicted small lipoprotein YifL